MKETITMEEVDARITERILMFYRKLLMDGRLIDDERPHYGLPTSRRLSEQEMAATIPDEAAE